MSVHSTPSHSPSSSSSSLLPPSTPRSHSSPSLLPPATQRSHSPSKHRLQQHDSLSTSPSSSDTIPTPPAAKKRRVFNRELKYMMHGFGDDANPFDETAELVEDLVVDFITEMTQRAMDVGKGGKVHVNDIMYLIRRDTKKYARVRELLLMNEELKKARRAFEQEADI